MAWYSQLSHTENLRRFHTPIGACP